MLDRKLVAYALSGVYPFHMPGHKRAALDMPNPYTIDVTEIDGFDDLHHPEGILKEAQERAAKLYGAARSFYLVNGSTCGLLTAISAAVPRGGTLLMARNAHKAAYHAAYIRGLSTVYLYPRVAAFGVQGAVDPQEVEEKLRRKPGIHAALITSPTYEGVVSDVAAIARIAHQYGVPLIVDEAHGAHFGFHTAFPQSAVKLGADAVVQSMHKVLPSFTQTALLHLNPGLIKPAEAARFLDIFETSSPSYVLMAGMEKCIRLLALHGEELFCVYEKRLKEFYEKAKTFSKIHLMCREDFAPQEAFALDASKLVISAKNTDLSGQMLYETLKNEYLLQMEMVSGFYVLGMTSIMDREEGFLRLSRALSAIDKTARRQTAGDDAWLVPRLYAPKEKRMEFYEAMDASRETVSFDRAVGRTAGSMVNLSPPGVPVLVPGETIDAQFIKNIRKYIKSGQKPRGIADIRNEKIEVVNFQ